MLNRIIEFSVRNRVFVLVLTLLVAIGGWFAFENLPIDAVPDITNVQVQVNTQVEGLVPEEIERYVTFPIENSMGGVAGVQEVRSITRVGLSQVTIVFEEGTDIYRARQLVAERLNDARDSLPAGLQPTLGPVSTGVGEVFHYAVEAKEKAEGAERLKQLMELKAVQEWFIKPRLLTVKGVAEVNTTGGFEKQYHVQPKPEKLAQYGLHLDDLVEAIEQNNKNTGGGYIQQTAEQVLVQATGLVTSLDDIKAIPVKTLESLQTVTVGDVAEVNLGKELRTGASVINGEEAVLGSVLMLIGENSRTVSIRVADQIKEIQKGLPDWVKVEVLYDRSDLVNRTLSTVEHNLVYGASLVVIVLLLLMGNVRVAVITAFVIPLSLLITFIIMRWQGVSGNLMSLGALDFGIIIDGAVIVMDHCARVVGERAKNLGRDLSRAEVRESVIQATTDIREVAGFGELIVLVVFLPLFALTGIEGKMFTPMAATFCMALAAAFVLSFTVTPALASFVLSGKTKIKQPWIMAKLEALYQLTLGIAVKLRYLVLSLSLVAVLAAIVVFSRLGGEFLPQLDEGSLAVQFFRPTNVNLDQSVKLQEISEKIIRSFPEVRGTFSRIGTSEIATDPMGVNIADTYVLLKDPKDWPEVEGMGRTKADLIKAISEELQASVPGQRFLLSQPIQLRFNELLEGVRADVSVKIFGDDTEKLMELTEEVARVVRSVPGAGDVEADEKGMAPVLRVKPKESVLRRQGVSKQHILEAVETAVGGREAGLLFEGVMRYPIIVRLSESVRSDSLALQDLPIAVSQGLTLPLGQLADVRFEETVSSVRRESAKKRAAVLVNPRGRDTESFVQEAREKVAAEVKVPAGYYIEWGGNFKNLERARDRLMVLAPISLVVVFLMIFAVFRSFTQTLLIFACVPLALVGGVLGLLLNGLPFSISAGVGFIALSGIAVLNGVVLISYLNQKKVQGLSGFELIRTATTARLRPVLMTAMAAAFGFVPMMLATGAGAEVQRPLASVIVGGIISSTALTLIVLPSLYFMLEKRMRVSESSLKH